MGKKRRRHRAPGAFAALRDLPALAELYGREYAGCLDMQTPAFWWHVWRSG